MAEFVFISPGYTFVTRNVGVTTLGLVGETQKGPAFEPVFVADSGIFETRFGSQSIEKLGNGDLRYQTPYVANAYLSESNQLWVTRVLGLSGYDAGTSWAITLSAGVDPSTTAITNTVTGNSAFTGGMVQLVLLKRRLHLLQRLTMQEVVMYIKKHIQLVVRHMLNMKIWCFVNFVQEDMWKILKTQHQTHCLMYTV